MQQKYCDHGRSRPLLTITWPTCRARSSCESGGYARNASILPFENRSNGLTLGSEIQWMSEVGTFAQGTQPPCASRDVADIGKALGPQQLIGNVLGGDADAGDL